jgi:transposase
MNETVPAIAIIIGVDTHKLTHAAAAISTLGVRLGAMTIPVSGTGYQALEAWAQSLGSVQAFGVEGTGSYGAGLSRFLCERGHAVLEVNRPNRQLRYQKGKNDPLDAESAARAVLSGEATALPKAGTGSVEMIRHLKVARDTAVKSKTQAMQTLKAIIVISPLVLREQLCAQAHSPRRRPRPRPPCAQSHGAGWRSTRRSRATTFTLRRLPPRVRPS